MKLALRYDMRTPDIGVGSPEQYAAVLDHAAWADEVGFETVYLAEHHGADDGYCASPMILGSAILGRTRRLGVHLSALVAVLHHPLRLAEDLAALDLIGGGRVEVTAGIGYRDFEYRMFDVDRRRRARILEETIEVLRQSWTGEEFEFRGERVQVRPRPARPEGPPLYVGGSADASALRAARIGDGYRPAGAEKDRLYEVYAAELRKLGRPVPPQAPALGPLFLFVSDDPARDWDVVAPHVLYTTNSNAAWARERGVGTTAYRAADGVADLKRDPNIRVVTPEECLALCDELGDDSELVFQPLMGGLPLEAGWRSLRLFETEVLPELVVRGYRDAEPS
ncbi:LLM class flavin-dependent oxidoreductase [Gordonia sp. HY285]|uniref:LLM class flavin-dependent oxidoreductase n=1 Tax=Gordonia liuliyuniae TaxID=2911517 RepID=A0ABS9ITP6_9ACTN|nr:LLM class flavin-dependent oxidoreductase [Gordonia liuliyuniae]MCF8588935.1 LLM class flavin-dependent oxidoreductase [Gordonia liuliyuniae]MCF8609184.1 LLM class flavin-dependent oxidoreductase [Gordonia liuliyuniae]